MITREWLTAKVAGCTPSADASTAIQRLRQVLASCAEGFAAIRSDVQSPRLIEPRRGLLHDESASFLRALDAGWISVDGAGFVTLPRVRAKTPPGRYALLSKSGDGVSVNLEYLIQIGATAELSFDHDWRDADIDFERGEFDALVHDEADRPVLAMEAKARVTGSDSLEKLLLAWLSFQQTSQPNLESNAGRKWRELTRLCAAGPILVWLVADGARWPITAVQDGSTLRLTESQAEHRSVLAQKVDCVGTLNEAHPFDARFHLPSSVAASGHCSHSTD